MKRAVTLVAVIGMASTVLMAAGKETVSGQYVEARTAEIFTGGCIMGSEAETMGKQAVLAWKVDRGTFNGVSSTACRSWPRSPATEPGPARNRRRPATVRSAVFVDERANPAQRIALVAMANDSRRHRRHDRLGDAGADSVHRRGQRFTSPPANVALDVSKEMTHDPTCGAMQWFHPLATIDDADDGRRRQTRSTARRSAPSGATRTSAPRSSAPSATKRWPARPAEAGRTARGRRSDQPVFLRAPAFVPPA